MFYILLYFYSKIKVLEIYWLIEKY
jgi:hypothetical protein